MLKLKRCTQSDPTEKAKANHVFAMLNFQCLPFSLSQQRKKFLQKLVKPHKICSLLTAEVVSQALHICWSWHICASTLLLLPLLGKTFLKVGMAHTFLDVHVLIIVPVQPSQTDHFLLCIVPYPHSLLYPFTVL